VSCNQNKKRERELFFFFNLLEVGEEVAGTGFVNDKGENRQENIGTWNSNRANRVSNNAPRIGDSSQFVVW
jgi:hypothetical protein